MFKNGKSKPKTSTSDVTVINRGTTVEGEIKVDGTIRIYGRLNGTVRSEGKVIVAEHGVLSGDLYADAADVSGTVEGVIEADRLDLRSTATVEGNVIVKKFTTETGAIFVGDCKMPQNGTLSSGNAPKTSAHDTADEAANEVGDAENEEAPQQEEQDEQQPSKAKQEKVPADATPTNGGVKPLPNKPAATASPEEEVEAADVAEGDTRPRFW